MTDSDVAIAAASAGAAEVRAHYGRPVDRYAKEGTDFATEADVASERAIRAIVAEQRPDDVMVGEEEGRSGPDGATREWLVDPLCGTRNFAAGLPLMSSNVALAVDGRVSASAAVECVGDEGYWTDGEQAWVRRDRRDRPAEPSAETLMVAINLEVDQAGRRRASDLLADPAFFETYQPRITSSTLALAWVAAGRHAAYLTEGDLADNVHFAAGLGVCLAAGCTVTGLDGAPVGNGPTGLLAAADRETHAALLRLYSRG